MSFTQDIYIILPAVKAGLANHFLCTFLTTFYKAPYKSQSNPDVPFSGHLFIYPFPGRKGGLTNAGFSGQYAAMENTDNAATSIPVHQRE